MLDVVVVIDDDLPPSQRLAIRSQAADARRVGLRERRWACALGQRQLSEVGQLRHVGHRQLVDECDDHALSGFVEVVDDPGDRQVDRAGRDLRQIVARVGDGHARRGHLGTPAALDDGASNLHPLALGHSGAARATRDEDAFGGVGIGVGVDVFLLQEETRQLTRRLEVADDDALDGDRDARNRCGRCRCPGRRG